MRLIGARAKTSTALQSVSDTPGLEDISSYAVTGKDSQLVVSNVRIARTPRVFKFNFTESFTGGHFFPRSAHCRPSIPKRHSAANALAQSPTVVITTLANELLSKGFSQQYP